MLREALSSFQVSLWLFYGDLVVVAVTSWLHWGSTGFSSHWQVGSLSTRLAFPLVRLYEGDH